MKYDSSKHDLEFRPWEPGDRWLTPTGEIVTEPPRASYVGPAPIVRDKPAPVKDWHWLMQQPDDPDRAYAGTNGRDYRWVDGVLQVRHQGTPPGTWAMTHVKRHCLEATFEEEIKPGGHAWLWSLPDGTEVEHPNDLPRLYYVKQGGLLNPYSDGQPLAGGGPLRLAESASLAFDGNWRLHEKPQPAPGSREAVAASDEGACWWCDHPNGKPYRDEYYRRTKGGKVQHVDTLTGNVTDTRRILSETGWSPVLDANGKPAEPKVGSQLWAQIVCRDLGHEVVRNSDRYHWNKDERRFEFWDKFESRWSPATTFLPLNIEWDRAACLAGWSLYSSKPAPDPRAALREKIETFSRELLAAVDEMGGAK